MRSLDKMYLRAVICIMAGVLIWHMLGGEDPGAVLAQTTPQYSVEVVSADASQQHSKALATSINRVSGGRELISVIPDDQKGRYLAVFKERGQ